MPATAQGDRQYQSLHEEEEDFFQDIELLQSHGINVADIKKLKTAGICTVRGIQMVTKKKLCSIKGLSEAKVDKMKEAVMKICGSNAGFRTAPQHSVNRIGGMSSGSAPAGGSSTSCSAEAWSPWLSPR